jgi:iron complex outermembrane receptor protein
MKKNRLIAAMSATVLGTAAAGFSATAIAQQDVKEVEEVVTIGTRAKPRSVTESPAPVDVISSEEILSQGGTDMSDLIRNVVPSYNVNDQPISDAATLVRPANLRGLAPDHTLLLVNGKRRHRASVITWLGNGISNGSQGPDVAAIPAIALKSVEVLRDGAAAQYGSDAIAGVMNFQLNDAQDGGALELKLGEYSAGDGQQFTIAANKGFAIGSDGFFNVSAEYGSADDTNRAIQRDDAQALIDAGYEGVPEPAMIWGTPKIEDDLKLWANFGIMLGDAAELYGYANHNTKTVDGGFYYRNPTNRGGVYSADGGETLLIGDLTPNDGMDCPVVTMDGVTPDATAFQQVLDDPNCFSFQELIPGGFTPRFGGDITDKAFQLGVKGEAGDLTWDLSSYYGYHESDFFINNTVNASYGPDTQRDFNPGAYSQEDMNLAADFTYLVSDTLALAFGTEYRTEEFSITAGDVQSYTQGPLADQGFSTSSNGFPGFSPTISGSWSRSNYAAYIDAELDVTEDFLVTAALRFEDFEDFGTTTNYKIGGNYAITDTLGVRATYSTGFKAPTPGQANASNVSTQFVNGILVNQGTIPSTSAVALAAGGKPLDPEKSKNFTLGTYFAVGGIDFTIDYFNIDVSDRLNQSEDKTLDDDQKAVLASEGIDTSDIAQFRFFTNDFDTNTSGVDIVATTDVEWASGVTTFTLNYNHVHTNVEAFNPDTVGESRIRQIEETTPETRANFSANHQMDKLRVISRVSYYGSFWDSEAGGVFDDAYLLDLEVGYDINEQHSVSFGGRNLTDEKGCSIDDCSPGSSGDLGLQYAQFSPFGFNGTYFYGRYRFNF